MKIATFSDQFYPELSGISDSIIANSIQFGKDNHIVDFFVPLYSEKNYATAKLSRDEPNFGKNLRIHRINSLPFPGGTMQARAVIPRTLLNLFDTDPSDIVHAHTFFGAGFDALCLSKIKKIPMIGTNHSLIEAFVQYSPIKARWIKNLLGNYVIWYYNKCDLVTTPSRFLLDDMKKKGFTGKGIVVSNPIEKSFFNPRASKEILKKELGFSNFTILYVGRFSTEKNIQVLIDAFIDLAQDLPDASLVLVGHGLLRTQFENQVRENNLSDKIKIIGPFLGENKPVLYDIFHAADVFVIPSTSETQSMAALQAMASGIPVIGANAGALPELIGKENGYLFEPDNKSELLSHMHALYDIKKRNVTCEHALIFAKNSSEESIALLWEKTYTDTVIAMHKKTFNNITISLIIPAYNEEKYIGKCLEYAIKNSHGTLLEIIVIDNASTDRTKQIAESYPGIRVVTEEKKGLTRARQRGYLEAKGDILAYIDADTQMPKGWVETISREFSNNKNKETVVCVSGPCLYYDLSKFESILVKVYWYVIGLPAYLVVGYMVHGANFAIRRDILDKMNGFDTSIEFYGEDTDIARRASLFGKVKFKIGVSMYASARRFKDQGLYKTTFLYVANFISEVFVRKPLTEKYSDFR
jgi:1,2-diacylglycerol 3-alpha-glucosyltransferase